jgi:hypothetical protein
MVKGFLDFLIQLSALLRTLYNMGAGWRGFGGRLKYRKGSPSSRIFVLGNGPSLSADYARYRNDMQHTDAIGVNRFAHSGLFAELKPAYYILCDPVFCGKESEVGSGELLEMRKQLFEEIRMRLTWPMTLLIPAYARPNIEAALSHPLLKTVCFNSVKLDHRLPGWIRYPLLEHNFATFSLMNVMIGAIYCTINLGYRQIILVGADHSWSEQMRVDGQNRIYIEDTHFYDGDQKAVPVYLFSDQIKKTGYSAAVFFQALVNAFTIYQELQKYAVRLGVTVWNASARSYIDAFERIQEIPPLQK